MTVSDASLDESGSNLSKIAATSLLLGVTRTSSEAYVTTASAFFIFATILFCLPAEYIILSKVLTMFTFALAGTTILFAHLYWKNVLATIIVTVVAICLYLVSIGSMSPAEAGNKVNERIEKIGS